MYNLMNFQEVLTHFIYIVCYYITWVKIIGPTVFLLYFKNIVNYTQYQSKELNPFLYPHNTFSLQSFSIISCFQLLCFHFPDD